MTLFVIAHRSHAMVGGKTVAGHDPVAPQVAQIATWAESKVMLPGLDGHLTALNSRHVVANCTATFVAEDLLLTAGHCIAKPNTLKLDLSFDKQPVKNFGGIGRTFSNTSFTIVDSRIPANGDDLALVKIDRKVHGAGLPLLARKVSLADAIVSYGFGLKAPTKMNGWEASVSGPFDDFSLSPQFFEKPLKEELTQAQFQQVRSPNDTFTVLKKQGPGGHCYGDSGGPNLLESKAGWAIVGVTVQVLPSQNSVVCANQSAIVNVRSQQAWLNQAARELGSQIRWQN